MNTFLNVVAQLAAYIVGCGLFIGLGIYLLRKLKRFAGLTESQTHRIAGFISAAVYAALLIGIAWDFVVNLVRVIL